MSEYVLGTNDDELNRLGMQHGVWRADAHAGWKTAGFTLGSTVIDVGCGPGFATYDLAEVVGPTGRVVAVDKSERYLAHVAAVLAQRGLANVELHACDLDVDALPVRGASGAWARWVFAFVREPRELVARVAEALAPGGTFVVHEYFDYRTWRPTPRVPEIEEFVAAVMTSWRAQGGEPDIALDLVRWLPELGFDIVEARPVIDIVAPGDAKWTWVTEFGRTGLPRLVELGVIDASRGSQIAAAWDTLAARPGVRMVTPAVLEIVARLR